MTPSVSVVIPVFNTERFVREAIESVLSQDPLPEPIEIIVVDDGSSDTSMSVVAEFGTTVLALSQPHAGIGAARNLGVSNSRGDYLAFLDADDAWATQKLRLQLEVLSSSSPPGLVTGMVEQFRDTPSGQRVRVGDLAKGYLAGAILLRRETFQRVGPFNETLRAGEFIDWYARATEMGLSVHVLEEIVLHRRLHDANTARTSGDANHDVPSVLRAALARRRAAAGEQ